MCIRCCQPHSLHDKNNVLTNENERIWIKVNRIKLESIELPSSANEIFFSSISVILLNDLLFLNHSIWSKCLKGHVNFALSSNGMSLVSNCLTSPNDSSGLAIEKWVDMNKFPSRESLHSYQLFWLEWSWNRFQIRFELHKYNFSVWNGYFDAILRCIEVSYFE